MPAAAWALFSSENGSAPFAIAALAVMVLTRTLPLLPQQEVHRAAAAELEAPLRFHAAMALTPTRFSALAIGHVHVVSLMLATRIVVDTLGICQRCRLVRTLRPPHIPHTAGNQGAQFERTSCLGFFRKMRDSNSAHIERRITTRMDEQCLDFESMSRMAMRSEAADSKMPTIESDSIFDELQH